jgi:hypothetical protein
MNLNDDNTLEDIQGAIACLEADLEDSEPEFPIRPRLEELLVRIDAKLQRNKNAIRRNWFTIAREHAQSALNAFDQGDCAAAGKCLRKCWEYLEQGNKAHRRKTAFVVGPDGIVHLVNPGEQSDPR